MCKQSESIEQRRQAAEALGQVCGISLCGDHVGRALHTALDRALSEPLPAVVNDLLGQLGQVATGQTKETKQ